MAEVEQNASKKKLTDLRVIDLRSELEKRGLEKSGVKTALLERLSKALQDEGKDPEEYLFETVPEKTAVKAPVKRSSRKLKEGETNEEEEDEDEKEEEEDKESVKDESSKDAEKTTESEEKKSADLEGKEEQKIAQCNGTETEENVDSPPKPETAPVVAPLTVEDVIKLDTSSKLKATDNDSLIVNPDETQSDMDSSVNEKDSVNDENMQEEEEETTKLTTETSTAKETSEDKKDKAPAKKETPVKKAADKKEVAVKKQDSSVKGDSSKTAAKTPEKSSTVTTSASSPATDGKKKSTVEKPDTTAKDAAAKKSIILISNDSVKRVAASSKNLWVSGLAEKTRANDLKALFSKYGKVSGAKIVTNARTPGTRCYGFITMATSEEAAACIEKLNHTELHGRMITVEKTTREPSGTIKRADLKLMQKSSAAAAAAKKSDAAADGTAKGASDKSIDSAKLDKTKTDKAKPAEKKGDKTKPGDKKADTLDEKSKDGTESSKVDDAKKDKRSSKDRELRSRDRSHERKRYRDRRSRSRGRGMGNFRRGFGFNRGFQRGSFGYRPFQQRGPFMDRHRRDRSRSRESPRRRFTDLRQREIERKNREESIRLERERERLRIEREKLERERAEVLRLEREKQRFERERLEREKMELRKRTAITLDDRRGKRSFDGPRELETFWEERKRPRREPSLEPTDNFRDIGRERGAFNDRGRDRFESRSKGGAVSPSFNAPGRREGRHDSDSFRSRNTRDGSDRGRDDWKGKQGGRDRNFERPSRNSFSDRGSRNFDRPNPWEGSSTETAQKFESPPQMASSQWTPVNKPPENWGRIEQPPQERWGSLEHPRGQPNIIGHPPNMGHPPNPMVFGGPPSSDIIPPMAGHFPVDRFNSNMMRRF